MAELVAWYQADPTDPPKRLAGWPLPVGRPLTVGRMTAAPPDRADAHRADCELSGEAVEWVPAEHQRFLSYRHFTAVWDGDRLRVTPRTAPKPPTNPVRRADGAEAEGPFAVPPGERFRVGRYEFVVAAPAAAADGLYTDRAVDEVRRERVGDDPDRLIDALQAAVTQVRPTDDEDRFHQKLLAALLSAVPAAGGAAVMRLPAGPGPKDSWVGDRRPDEDVKPAVLAATPGTNPSLRLAARALRGRDRRVQRWERGQPGGVELTPSANSDWAVCAPVKTADGCEPRAVYVCGECPDLELAAVRRRAEKVAVLFAELYAGLLAQRREYDRVQELKKFLPTHARRLLQAGRLDDALRLRQATATVLFCDLRGSTGWAEGAGGLDGAWQDTFSRLLDAMSGPVIALRGVVGEFLGDAVMGFWGWPDEQPDDPLSAWKAADDIAHNFERLRAKQPDAGWDFGIGIAHGPALVGRLGNYDLNKVGVFGPTVNRASRLEALTKRVGVPALVDAATARRLVSASQARTRRVGRIAPAGLKEPGEVFGLFVGDDRLHPPDYLVNEYEEAAGLFERGEVGAAGVLLAANAGKGDGPTDFLFAYLQELGDRPPDRDAAGCYVRLARK